MQMRGFDIETMREKKMKALCRLFEDERRRCFGWAFREKIALGAAVAMMNWSSLF